MRPIFISLATLISYCSFAQTDYSNMIQGYRDSIDREFSDPELSILEEGDLKGFKGLEYFPISEEFLITASAEWIKEGKVFEMATSTERRPKYQPVVKLRFLFNGKNQELTAYKSVKLNQDKDYVNYLFLPFTDETNGDKSYGGGRYLEVDASTITDVLQIDFNKCYNPYCAYNGKYSCPVPPKENNLNVKIEAGVQSYDNH